MKKLSLIACGLLLTSSSIFADSAISKAFKDGKASGDFSVYHETTDTDNSNKSGYTAGSASLNFETAEVNGFSVSLGFTAAHQFGEENNGDYDKKFSSNAIMNTAAIKYASDFGSITVGRQEVGLEWMGDYHEAVVAAITAIPDTTVVAAFTQRSGVAGNDEITDFAKFNKDGAYLVDVKYEGISNVVLNPYYYDAIDVASFYGLKADFDTDMFGATAHYAASSEDAMVNDGSVGHLEARASISGLSLAAGYITTDEKVGAASIITFDDNMSPFEDGRQVYVADADTYYLSAGYTIADVSLSALYGTSEYGKFEESELNIAAEYSFNDELAISALYADVDADEANAQSDYNKVLASITYSY